MNFPLESFKPFELPLAGFALRGFESAYFIDYSYLIGNSVLTGGERGMNFPLESFKPFELPLAGFALRGFESAYFIDYSYLIGNSVLTGGERGIRTLGTSIRIYIRLAGERLRPARPSLH